MPAPIKLVLIAIVLAAGLYDLRIRRIPNWINLSGIILGIGLNSYFDGLAGFKTAGTGLILALCVYIPLYALKGMGAGDVKLMAAVGSLAGPGPWLTMFLCTALLGGVISLIAVLYRKRGAETLRNVAVIVSQLVKGKAPSAKDSGLTIQNEKALRMPHGAIIAAAVGLVLALHWQS